MSHEQTLMRMICERPDDDAPRLVLCDIWDETGRVERAEFCRGQIELARMGPKPRMLAKNSLKHMGDGYWTGWVSERSPPPVGARIQMGRRLFVVTKHVPREQAEINLMIFQFICRHLKGEGFNRQRHKALMARDKELLERWGPVWIKELDAEMCDQFPGRLWQWGRFGEWRRGFVDSVICTPETFVRVAKYLFAFAPVERVMLLKPGFYWEPGDVWASDAWSDPGALTIPHKIYQHLKMLQYARPYPTQTDAFADLNQACVAYGREQAGLPQLAGAAIVGA